MNAPEVPPSSATGSAPPSDSPQPLASVATASASGTAATPVFTMAEIRESKATQSAAFLGSKMWWVTLACFVVAFWLTWRSIPSKGPTIIIRFPDGHGLKAGDAVRHRGIDAGIVESVALSEDLSQITATVTLTPGASGLAREGSRFWIVRPQLSFAGVSGLETAVGAKYIGVSPGDPEASGRNEFEGLNAAPPDENSGEGIDIVLRSDAKHGVSVGAPVSWRGVEVGQILSINLSPDARYVDVLAQINADYTRLLRTTSQFWVTSGLGIDVGLSGVRLNADSLSTIVRGGVSFATPAVSKDKSPVTSGQMFVLQDKPDPDWLTAASSLPLIDFDLPPTVTIQGTRKTSLLGIPRNQKFTVNGLLLAGGSNGPQILTAGDIVTPQTDGTDPAAITQEFVVGSPLSEATLGISYLNAAPAPTTDSGESATTSGYLWLPLNQSTTEFASVSRDLIREPTLPEECCLCRSVKGDRDATSVIQSIGQYQLKVIDGMWSVTTDLGDLSPWHGAPVISMQDGKVIGIFLAAKSGATIAPLKKLR